MKTLPVMVHVALVSCWCAVHADEIHLSNGQKAQTTILDTAGCSVRIMRRGNKVDIKKKLISMIIMGGDTIDLSDYRCEQPSPKKKAVIRYRDTPEYRLMAYVDNCSEAEGELLEGARVAFATAPLEGRYSPEEYKRMRKPLMALFDFKWQVSLLTNERLLGEIKQGEPTYRYAVIPRRYHASIRSFADTYWTNALAMGPSLPVERQKRVLVTSVELVIVDTRTRTIVYRLTRAKRRRAYGVSEQFAASMFTSARQEDALERMRLDRKLEKNARSLRRKIVRDFSEYLRTD